MKYFDQTNGAKYPELIKNLEFISDTCNKLVRSTQNFVIKMYKFDFTDEDAVYEKNLMDAKEIADGILTDDLYDSDPLTDGDVKKLNRLMKEMGKGLYNSQILPELRQYLNPDQSWLQKHGYPLGDQAKVKQFYDAWTKQFNNVLKAYDKAKMLARTVTPNT